MIIYHLHALTAALLLFFGYTNRHKMFRKLVIEGDYNLKMDYVCDDTKLGTCRTGS
jgi:hypothetical protein